MVVVYDFHARPAAAFWVCVLAVKGGCGVFLSLFPTHTDIIHNAVCNWGGGGGKHVASRRSVCLSSVSSVALVECVCVFWRKIICLQMRRVIRTHTHTHGAHALYFYSLAAASLAPWARRPAGRGVKFRLVILFLARTTHSSLSATATARPTRYPVPLTHRWGVLIQCVCTAVIHTLTCAHARSSLPG